MPSVTLYEEISNYVDEALPTTSHERSYAMVVGINAGTGTPDGGSSTTNYWNATGGRCQGWIRFDLSSIPIASTIVAARLTFNPFYVSTPSYGDATLLAYRSTNITWDDFQTWNTQDSASVSGSLSGSAYLDGGGGSVNYIDLVADVQAALASGKVTWVLKFGIGDLTDGDGVNIACKNWPLSTVNLSSLDISYTAAGSRRRSSVVFMSE